MFGWLDTSAPTQHARCVYVTTATFTRQHADGQIVTVQRSQTLALGVYVTEATVTRQHADGQIVTVQRSHTLAL